MGDLPDLANLDYLDRVNRAIDHVTRNLSQPLKLEEVARVAAFSPFHFHRVFRAVVGETLHDFVKRVRLERAVSVMSHEPARTLTDVALECGFSSSSDFSRSFRAHYGISPRAFDVDVHRAAGRDRLISTSRLEQLPERSDHDAFEVTLRRLPARRVAYLRVFRPFEMGRVPEAAARLVAWATERGLEHGQWLGWQWEDPELVPLELCRYDVGVEVTEGAALSEEVSETRFPAMTVAELQVKGPLDLELRALEWLYGAWLPRSGHTPDHQPAFEAWDGLPYAHGESHFELKVQLPVRRP